MEVINWLPHCNHDRRKHEIVGAGDQVTTILALRLGVPKLDKGRRRWADEVWLPASFHYLIDCFPRAHWYRVNDDRPSGSGAPVLPIESIRGLANPLLLLRTIREYKLEAILRNRSRRRFRAGF